MSRGRGARAAALSRFSVVDRPLPDVLVLASAAQADARGAFTRLFCRDELLGLGVTDKVAQANLSRSATRHTLRGLHYQVGESAETKIVTCLTGAVFDVVLDLRPGSATFGQAAGVELSGRNGRIVVVPRGCAHGFLTLADDATVLYFVSAAWDPAAERGVRWNDPAFVLPWPAAPALVSERDLAHPDFDPARPEAA